MDIEKLKISIEADISRLMSGLNTAKNFLILLNLALILILIVVLLMGYKMV